MINFIKTDRDQILDAAKRIFKVNISFSGNVLIRQPSRILFLSCMNGLWWSLRDIWDIIMRTIDKNNSKFMLLTSFDEFQGRSKHNIANYNFKIKIPIDYKTLMKNKSEFFDTTRLNIVLFTEKEEFILYANEDFSLYLITENPVKSNLLDKVKAQAILDDFYIGDNFDDFSNLSVNKLGFSQEMIQEFKTNWF